MSYLATGTSYPSFNSTINPGLNSGGQDYVISYNSTSGILAGVNILTSRVGHAVSGAQAYVINSATPSTFQVFDLAGHADVKNITVSGATINGTTSATISAAYGVKTFVNTSGATWIAY